jgi:glucose-6-phosphate 1-dehydrogenase
MSEPVAPPMTLVIFGARGDLTSRLLIPALVNLTSGGLIGDGLTIIGVDRDPGSDADLRAKLEQFQQDHSAPAWTQVRDRCRYLPGDFTDPATFARLAGLVPDAGANVCFYLATTPAFFGGIIDALAKVGLLNQAGGFRRIVVEKPFGHDFASAQALNARILKVADENQIYRIDHFLGKETVRNIMVTRFGNAVFEALWNNNHIDHVQITAAEAIGVGRRGKFYDATGALRDMVPNHLFQLLAMIGMEPPNSFAASAMRAEKAKLIDAVRAPGAQQATTDAVRGRYRAGTAQGQALPDYLAETDVDPASMTETYVAMKLMVDSWRWAGVPFYLRTGKALSARDTEVVIVFKPVPLALFRDTDVTHLASNRLVIQVQPDEAISLDFTAKKPGLLVDTAPVSMVFSYADAFQVGHTTGYEALLYDVMIGDQSLFQRADEIEGAWRAVQPFLDAWAQSAEPPEDYAAGTAGPSRADALIERDGRHWHTLG